MNLYDLLVTGICPNIIFKNLILMEYEINKFNYNLNNLNLHICENLKMKFKHPTLKCSFKFTYYLNNIENIIYFQTYNTFTTSSINSIHVFNNQYLNNCDFIIDQNYSFVKINNLSDYDLKKITRVRNNFINSNINNYITYPLKDSLIKKQQSTHTQIIYLDELNIRMNPLKWSKYINKFKI